METRQMTFEEIFKSRLEYYEVHISFFSKSQIIFLTSILNFENIGITKKQKQAFINTVDSVFYTNLKL